MVRVAHGPLASCDDVHTCPGGSAWAATGGAETGGAEGAGLWMREQIRLLGPCVPLVRGRELGDAIRQAKIVVTDCIQGDTVYASTLEHAYLVAKYHEIAACGAVIAGNLPLMLGIEESQDGHQDENMYCGSKMHRRAGAWLFHRDVHTH